MKTIPVCSWEQYQIKFKELEQLRNELTSEMNWSDISNLFYRGQADAENWKLETTLERRLHNYRISFDNYYGLISGIKPEIESFISKERKIPAIYQFRDWLKKFKNADIPIMAIKIPGIEYMIYLRHHGFPSPLLDWTKSPFIAAYFAFQNINKGGKISIHLCIY